MEAWQQMAGLARQCGERLRATGRTLVTAESLTGGLIGAALTAVPGSSAWVEGGFITYSNDMKQAALGVRAETLAQHGAVSEATVREMAQGALARSPADLAVAVSGVAGPDGGTEATPVGTVWLCWAARDGRVDAARRRFVGDRDAVRAQTVLAALEGVLARLG